METHVKKKRCSGFLHELRYKFSFGTIGRTQFLSNTKKTIDHSKQKNLFWWFLFTQSIYSVPHLIYRKRGLFISRQGKKETANCRIAQIHTYTKQKRKKKAKTNFFFMINYCQLVYILPNLIRERTKKRRFSLL